MVAPLRMSLLLLFSLSLFWPTGGALGLDPQLAELCWWPVLSESDPASPSPTRLAQSLLNGYFRLESVSVSPLAVDGIFGPKTAAAVELYRKHSGLAVNGFLDHASWPHLVAVTSPLAKKGSLLASGGGLTLNATEDVVRGLQRVLVDDGFLHSSAITGSYGSQTASAVAAFKKSRGQGGSGDSAGTETFHLLASGCNASRDTQAFWFDAGWPQGVLSVDTLKCLHDAGFEFATFECWLEYTGWYQNAVTNVANARKAGFRHVGVYMFPIRAHDPLTQVPAMLKELAKHNVEYDAVMLDIEGQDWGKYSQASNRDFMTKMKQAFAAAAVNVTIYCGREWPAYFGENFNIFAESPLVYAHYDNVPSFYDFDSYGGWKEPSGKQFWDGQQGERLCGTGALDWDWSPRPFWGKN
jgi:peptidoglycan hydrolase-like protein with peptidoglycan-binding domain